jgi:hypothetical protein
VYGAFRVPAPRMPHGASIWQNKAKNFNDFNLTPIPIPSLPFHPQML